MEVNISFETSAGVRTTRRNIPEDRNIYPYSISKCQVKNETVMRQSCVTPNVGGAMME
jgi:hypothetical protein